MFESRSGHSSHCVILLREFTHTCSRSTQPSHPSAGRRNWGAALCCDNNWHVPSVHYPRAREPAALSWCQAEGYRNGRSAPNPMGSAEPKGRCCYADLCGCGGPLVASWIRNWTVPGLNPVAETRESLRNSCEQGIYIQLLKGDSSQPCLTGAATTDMFPWFTSP